MVETGWGRGRDWGSLGTLVRGFEWSTTTGHCWFGVSLVGGRL